ncbi:acetyltransferase [Bacillaceae bacterium SAS-127]|nr:acetyltransferase [Bacillaceae bacterium SAS-127]
MLGNLTSLVKEIKHRWNWSKSADRLGPDMLGTHFKFYIPTLQRKICQEKFLYFGEKAEFRIGAYAVGCSNIKIGDNVVIRPNSILMATKNGRIDIEKDVLVGSGVQIYVSNHKFDDVSIPIYYQGHSDERSVRIQEGSWIGANVVILPGVTIGRNSVVGAGSIVTKDVPDFTIVAGNPARVIRNLN